MSAQTCLIASVAKNSGLQMSSEDVKAIAEVVTAVGSPVDSMADAKIVSVIMENVIPSGDKVKSGMFGSKDKEMRGSPDVMVSKTEVMEEVMHAIEEKLVKDAASQEAVEQVASEIATKVNR